MLINSIFLPKNSSEQLSVDVKSVEGKSFNYLFKNIIKISKAEEAGSIQPQAFNNTEKSNQSSCNSNELVLSVSLLTNNNITDANGTLGAVFTNFLGFNESEGLTGTSENKIDNKPSEYKTPKYFNLNSEAFVLEINKLLTTLSSLAGSDINVPQISLITADKVIDYNQSSSDSLDLGEAITEHLKSNQGFGILIKIGKKEIALDIEPIINPETEILQPSDSKEGISAISVIKNSSQEINENSNITYTSIKTDFPHPLESSSPLQNMPRLDLYDNKNSEPTKILNGSISKTNAADLNNELKNISKQVDSASISEEANLKSTTDAKISGLTTSNDVHQLIDKAAFTSEKQTSNKSNTTSKSVLPSYGYFTENKTSSENKNVVIEVAEKSSNNFRIINSAFLSKPSAEQKVEPQSSISNIGKRESRTTNQAIKITENYTPAVKFSAEIDNDIKLFSAEDRKFLEVLSKKANLIEFALVNAQKGKSKKEVKKSDFIPNSSLKLKIAESQTSSNILQTKQDIENKPADVIKTASRLNLQAEFKEHQQNDTRTLNSSLSKEISNNDATKVSPKIIESEKLTTVSGTSKWKSTNKLQEKNSNQPLEVNKDSVVSAENRTKIKTDNPNSLTNIDSDIEQESVNLSKINNKPYNKEVNNNQIEINQHKTKDDSLAADKNKTRVETTNSKPLAEKESGAKNERVNFNNANHKLNNQAADDKQSELKLGGIKEASNDEIHVLGKDGQHKSLQNEDLISHTPLFKKETKSLSTENTSSRSKNEYKLNLQAKDLSELNNKTGKLNQLDNSITFKSYSEEPDSNYSHNKFDKQISEKLETSEVISEKVSRSSNNIQINKSQKLLNNQLPYSADIEGEDVEEQPKNSNTIKHEVQNTFSDKVTDEKISSTVGKHENTQSENHNSNVSENKEEIENTSGEKQLTAGDSAKEVRIETKNTYEGIKQSASQTDRFNQVDAKTDKAKVLQPQEILKEVHRIIESSEKQTAVLKLVPKELGTLKIILDTVDNSVIAKIEVENEAVGSVVRNNVEQLKQSLAQNGVNLGSISVTLANSDHKQSGSFNSKRKNNSGFYTKSVENTEEKQSIRKLGYNTYEYLA
ncbi:MAG: flagellar hook-length control protein FliK [Ignavibacteriaceae bacterium]|nr:flagellar hook-length control protein FliK [Ignavibacteriaceae bacterium]